MMKKFLLSCLLMLLGCSLGFSQGGLYVGAGGSLTITGGASITLDNTKLENNGTINNTSGTLRFIGNATTIQTSISGTGQTNLNHLIINKAANDLQINQNIFLTGDLTLSSGGVQLNTGNIDFGNSGKIVHETETSRIYGTGGYLQATVNLNAPDNTNPANLGAIIASSANLGSTVIKRTHAPFTISNPTIQRVYEITPTNSSELNATLKLKYFDAELNGSAKNNLKVWNSTNNGNTWSVVSSNNDPTSNTLQTNALSAWGLFSGHVECPQVSISSNSPVCEKSILELSGTIFKFTFSTNETTYSWTGPNSFTSSLASPSREAMTPADAGIYTLVLTNNGCAVTSTVNITVYPSPAIPTINADNMQICKGGSVVLTGNCSTANASFRWLVEALSPNLPSSNSRVITEPGVYKGLCESIEGCLSNEVSITITQATDCNGQNFIKITPEKAAICPGQSITMTASGCTEKLTWTGGPATLSGSTATFSPTVTTTYFVQCSSGGSTSFDIVVATTNLAVNKNVTTGKDRFKAANTLTSDKKVGDANFTPGASVIYEAGNAIVLQPGFVAEKWSVFKAEIKTCN